MTRTALLLVLAGSLAASGAALAAERHPTPKPDREVVEEATGTPLESIAEEAAIAGDGDDRPEDEDPMQRTEDEMIESADEDGCTGSVGEGCPGGDN